MAKSRNSYTCEKKLKIISYAENHSNRAAGRKFGIDESLVRDWKKKKDLLKDMKPTKRALRKRNAFWPQIEVKLKTWILDEKMNDKILSTTVIRLKAKMIAKAEGITSFKGSECWMNLFMKRHNLCLRDLTVDENIVNSDDS